MGKARALLQHYRGVSCGKLQAKERREVKGFLHSRRPDPDWMDLDRKNQGRLFIGGLGRIPLQSIKAEVKQKLVIRWRDGIRRLNEVQRDNGEEPTSRYELMGTVSRNLRESLGNLLGDTLLSQLRVG